MSQRSSPTREQLRARLEQAKAHVAYLEQQSREDVAPAMIERARVYEQKCRTEVRDDRDKP
jgi:hypothetical protein